MRVYKLSIVITLLLMVGGSIVAASELPIDNKKPDWTDWKGYMVLREMFNKRLYNPVIEMGKQLVNKSPSLKNNAKLSPLVQGLVEKADQLKTTWWSMITEGYGASTKVVNELRGNWYLAQFLKFAPKVLEKGPAALRGGYFEGVVGPAIEYGNWAKKQAEEVGFYVDLANVAVQAAAAN